MKRQIHAARNFSRGQYRIAVFGAVLTLAVAGCSSQPEDKARDQTMPTQSVVPTSPAEAPSPAQTPTPTQTQTPTPTPTQSEPDPPADRIGHLETLVDGFLEEFDYVLHEHDASKNDYFLLMSMPNTLSTAMARVHIQDDAVFVEVSPSNWVVPESRRDQVAVYANRYNSKYSYNFMGMYPESGRPFILSMLHVESVIPSTAELDVAFHETVRGLTDHGDALVAVGQGGADPHQVFEETESALDEE